MFSGVYKKINELISLGYDKFALYPYGARAREVEKILRTQFGIREMVFIDNKRTDTTAIIKCSEIPQNLNTEYIILLISDRKDIYFQIREELSKYVLENYKVIDLLFDLEETKNYMFDIQKKEKVRVIFNPIYKSPILSHDMGSVGGNTGNLVFSESIKENIEYDYETFISEYWKRNIFGGTNVRAIMPSSNFLNSYAKWIEGLVPILESTDMSFTLVGVGAQGNLNDTPKDIVSGLSKAQKRFFELVSERATTIGVRGEFTAECLECMGIRNVDIIGCPSFYKYKDNYIKLKSVSMDKVLCTMSYKDEKVSDFAEHLNATIIAQTYRDTNSKNSYIFFDYNKWCEFLKENNFSFAFGTRFHGNMMALKHGIPTLWIVHDWRTLELARYLKLPHLTYDEFNKIKYPEQLPEYCDYTDVYENYPILSKKYYEFINKNF